VNLESGLRADSSGLSNNPVRQFVGVFQEELTGLAHDRRPLAEGEGGPLALGRNRQFGGDGDVVHAGPTGLGDLLASRRFDDGSVSGAPRAPPAQGNIGLPRCAIKKRHF
jgi:hypothetical protein